MSNPKYDDNYPFKTRYIKSANRRSAQSKHLRALLRQIERNMKNETNRKTSK